MNMRRPQRDPDWTFEYFNGFKKSEQSVKKFLIGSDNSKNEVFKPSNKVFLSCINFIIFVHFFKEFKKTL